jgi:TPR repeat protein
MGTFPRDLLAVSLVLFAVVSWAGDFKKGWSAYSSGDYATALAEWQDLAEAGDAKACYGMGMLYGNGFGVDMNDELALKFYGLAAAEGHAEAQYNLGVMHQNGWGVPLSDEEGMKWFRLAAEQGVNGAQMALGRFYAMDFADSYDPVKAYKWFALAAELGDYEAKTKVEFLASRMTPDQIAEADGYVDAWLASHKGLQVSQ